VAVALVRRVRRSGRRRLIALTGVAVVASVAVAGCTPQEAGSAAIVNGQRIRESTLQTQVRAANAELTKAGAAGAVSTDNIARDVLQLDIAKAVLTKTDQLLGVSVTPGELSSFRSQAISQNGGEDKLLVQLQQNGPLAPSQLNDYLTVYLLEQKLQAVGQADPDRANAALKKAEQETTIKINPRYGTFDLTQDKVEALNEPWLRDVSDRLTSASN
jgi:hypothetical protein